jgi:hypothetical protein
VWARKFGTLLASLAPRVADICDPMRRTLHIPISQPTR